MTSDLVKRSLNYVRDTSVLDAILMILAFYMLLTQVSPYL